MFILRKTFFARKRVIIYYAGRVNNLCIFIYIYIFYN